MPELVKMAAEHEFDRTVGETNDEVCVISARYHRARTLIDARGTKGNRSPQAYKYGPLFLDEVHQLSALNPQPNTTLLTTLIHLTMAQYQVGQKVKYTAIGGGNVENSMTTGEITEVLTNAEPAGSTGVTVNASEEEPRYVIKNDNTGKSTAYKAENIVEVIN
ncbi:unnamed protein product [Rhizoctonia solani]|uniref:Hypervirulence associated protein TUDOR domain-containing protein n=1 Tax=Rhizoctonia solani TaxID=456999 RepID=A0A8H2WZV0_9AGAM|nr:unnamed protein product [Rhizoctonia solani]